MNGMDQMNADAGPVVWKPHDELQRIRKEKENERKQISDDNQEEKDLYHKFDMPAVF